jgi:mannitol-1-/sugar-/sorbitol-6-/2-deoxyglucose-6-phosphatase
VLKGEAVEAVILDMDGLIIDTEPVWRAAQSAVFAGIGVALSERDLIDSTGQPVEELIPIWRRRSPDGDGTSPLTDAEVADRIIDGSSRTSRPRASRCRASPRRSRCSNGSGSGSRSLRRRRSG